MPWSTDKYAMPGTNNKHNHYFRFHWQCDLTISVQPFAYNHMQTSLSSAALLTPLCLWWCWWCCMQAQRWAATLCYGKALTRINDCCNASSHHNICITGKHIIGRIWIQSGLQLAQDYIIITGLKHSIIRHTFANSKHWFVKNIYQNHSHMAQITFPWVGNIILTTLVTEAWNIRRCICL